jgi:predicted phosphate transport protein (TIGR00153 family)|tara:strand:+ start:6230 stop:6910 length:681 start_codon:yes stop_codon:yes gene_type:complete
MALSNSISNIFGVSPIKPIQNHMAEVINCVSKLEDFLNATFDDDWVTAAEVFDQISADEQSADKLKKQFRMHMPKSLFMPVSRGDLLSIITQQDNIANLTKDICGIILGRQMAIPKALHADFIGFVGSSTVTCEKAHGAINELDELLEAGFAGAEVKFVQKLIRELAAQEQKVDKKELKLRKKLFNLEADLPPVNVIFMYNIIDQIGALADTAEMIGNQVELLLAK